MSAEWIQVIQILATVLTTLVAAYFVGAFRNRDTRMTTRASGEKDRLDAAAAAVSEASATNATREDVIWQRRTQQVDELIAVQKNQQVEIGTLSVAITDLNVQATELRARNLLLETSRASNDLVFQGLQTEVVRLRELLVESNTHISKLTKDIAAANVEIQRLSALLEKSSFLLEAAKEKVIVAEQEHKKGA